MDCRIHIDDTGERATMRLTGRVSVAELTQAFQRLTVHARYREGMARLWDARDSDLSGLTRADLNLIGQAARKALPTPGVRVAFLVARDIDFGIGRMFEITEGEALPASVRIFRDAVSAEAWLRH